MGRKSHTWAPLSYQKYGFGMGDPYAFGPPGSGSVIICTDPDPSIIQQKKKKKPLISTVL